jgi:phosphotransacetylase
MPPVVKPLVIGLTHAVQLAKMDSSVSQILDIATLAAHQAIKR